MSEALPATAFKILTAEQWQQWQQARTFTGSPVDHADGFIHLSGADQVAETAAKHFAGQNGLMLAEVDIKMLGDLVKWEPSRGGALFPHVYGSIPSDAVITCRPLAEAAP